ncbi:MAG: hypothetical protein FJW63_05445 [Actinobacteria bacterium]|nr:hypothetical protein [Actinomycetota bacterium]
MINYDYKIKVCVVGLGPAGIGVTYTLLHSKLASSTLCLDAGKNLSNRCCPVLQNKICAKCNPCEMISGFGGCSLLGGGKISTYPAGSRFMDTISSRNRNKILSKGLSLFDNYLHLQKPNITLSDIEIAGEYFKNLGFNYKYYDSYIYNQEDIRMMLQEVFSKIGSSGMTLLLNTSVIDIGIENNGFKLVAKREKEEYITIFSKYIVLGVGRLGRSMLRYINTKFNLSGEENHLDIGVRLEFPTDLYPDITKYHNDLKLLFYDARTFCVCKDGRVALYLLEDIFFTDGYLNPKDKSDLTNLGILIRLKPSKQNEIVLGEVKKRVVQISNAKPVCQTLPDYLGINVKNCDFSKCIDSSVSFWVQGDVNQCFPQPISSKIKQAVYYFASRLLTRDRWNEVNIFSLMVDYGDLSFPVNPDFSILPRMYLIGDCTGKFRGILQAFCSGIICAESIIGDENEKNL